MATTVSQLMSSTCRELSASALMDAQLMGEAGLGPHPGLCTVLSQSGPRHFREGSPGVPDVTVHVEEAVFVVHWQWNQAMTAKQTMLCPAQQS